MSQRSSKREHKPTEKFLSFTGREKKDNLKDVSPPSKGRTTSTVQGPSVSYLKVGAPKTNDKLESNERKFGKDISKRELETSRTTRSSATKPEIDVNCPILVKSNSDLSKLNSIGNLKTGESVSSKANSSLTGPSKYLQAEEENEISGRRRRSCPNVKRNSVLEDSAGMKTRSSPRIECEQRLTKRKLSAAVDEPNAKKPRMSDKQKIKFEETSTCGKMSMVVRKESSPGKTGESTETLNTSDSSSSPNTISVQIRRSSRQPKDNPKLEGFVHDKPNRSSFEGFSTLRVDDTSSVNERNSENRANQEQQKIDMKSTLNTRSLTLRSHLKKVAFKTNDNVCDRYSRYKSLRSRRKVVRSVVMVPMSKSSLQANTRSAKCNGPVRRGIRRSLQYASNSDNSKNAGAKFVRVKTRSSDKENARVARRGSNNKSNNTGAFTRHMGSYVCKTTLNSSRSGALETSSQNRLVPSVTSNSAIKESLRKFLLMGTKVAEVISETLKQKEEELLSNSSAFEKKCLTVVEALATCGRDLDDGDLEKIIQLLDNEQRERREHRQIFLKGIRASHTANMGLYMQMLKLLKSL